jgi:hypothetical protein
MFCLVIVVVIVVVGFVIGTDGIASANRSPREKEN